nr:ATP-dependent transcriptional activator malT [Klebsiella pneumoniae]
MNDALIVRVTGEENGQMQLEEIERQGLFLQRMDDSGEWFRYHPLFGSFLRQRCQWELAVELPEIHRAAAESWMAQGFPSEAIHHALAAGDAKMLRDILLNHAGACLTIASWGYWSSRWRRCHGPICWKIRA